MKKIIFTNIILLLVTIGSYHCSSSTQSDTLRIDSKGDNPRLTMWKAIRDYEYKKVYIIQETSIDDYGNEFLKDYWKVDDLKKEDYDEIKKYSNPSYFQDNMLNKGFDFNFKDIN